MWNSLVTRRVTESGSYASDQGLSALESVDDQMICLMRLILALSALLIIYIDPSEPDRFVAITYGALLIYSLYSAVLYYLSVRRSQRLPNSIAHWVDVGCFLILVALSSGTSSIFFFFFFFAILVASFRWGFTAGFRVTLASALLFTLVGFATAPAGPGFELNRFLLRPIYLLVLGYMIAFWGGREIRLKQRLRLLKEMTTLSNPRFGVGHTIGSMLKNLQAFYEAGSCLLIMDDPARNEARLFRLERNQLAESVRAEVIPQQLTHLLLSLSEDLAIIYQGKQRLHWFRDSSDYALNLKGKDVDPAEWQRASRSLAAKLEIESFISVPLYYRGKAIGRLYLTAHRGVFDNSDVDLLMQVVEQIMPVIHNIRLLARLASNAAEQERQRLARDIHDSVIQPYIGLHYKLAAIRNKIAAGDDVAVEITQLFQMTVDEVHTLRGFVRGLKDSDGQEDNFLSAVRRFADQFAFNYDIDVVVESRGEINLDNRFAAELIQIVHEGLSNVRKHTEATSSKITFERADSSLQLCIENNGGRAEDEASSAPFIPVSITERAEELGGHVDVERSLDGYTIVKVEIPL
jgi:signal transduction histidine kinase